MTQDSQTLTADDRLRLAARDVLAAWAVHIKDVDDNFSGHEKTSSSRIRVGSQLIKLKRALNQGEGR